METIVVVVVGGDRPGIVAGITGVLAELNANIVDISQTVLRGVFSMIMIVDITSAREGIETIRRRLQDRGRSLGVEVIVMHSDVFKYMERV